MARKKQVTLYLRSVQNFTELSIVVFFVVTPSTVTKFSEELVYRSSFICDTLQQITLAHKGVLLVQGEDDEKSHLHSSAVHDICITPNTSRIQAARPVAIRCTTEFARCES